MPRPPAHGSRRSLRAILPDPRLHRAIFESLEVRQLLTAALNLPPAAPSMHNDVIVATPAVSNIINNDVSSFQITGDPGATVNQPYSFTVTAIGNSGQTVTSFNGTIDIGSSDPNASVPTDVTMTDG